ncbi:MAG: hypothetical protein IPP48_02665 [Chitinophagaceae bacterium]|nr:hypothetical protein [Chitinophagaceae bacterium]
MLAGVQNGRSGVYSLVAWYGGHERSFTTARLTPQPNNAREFFATGIQTNNNVNFSKATDNYSFRASYSNLDVRGLLPNTGMNKNNFNVNTSLNLTEKLTVSTNVNYITNNLKGEIDDSYANATSGSFNQWFHRDLDMSIVKELRGLKTPTGIWASWNHQNPNTYDVNNQKNFYGAYYWYNPYTYSDLSPIITRNDRLFGNIGLSYKLSPSITINGTYRKQQNTTFTEQKYSSQLFESGVKTAGGNCPQCFGQYVTQNTFSNRDNFQGSLVYSKKIKNFQVDGDVGFDVFHQVTKSNGGFTNNGLNVPDLFTLTNSKLMQPL